MLVPIGAIDAMQFRALFQDAVFGQDAAEVGEWIDQRIAANDRSGADNGVATDFCAVAHDCAKFTESGRDQARFDFYAYLLSIQSDVREDNSGPKVGLIT